MLYKIKYHFPASGRWQLSTFTAAGLKLKEVAHSVSANADAIVNDVKPVEIQAKDIAAIAAENDDLVKRMENTIGRFKL